MAAAMEARAAHAHTNHSSVPRARARAHHPIRRFRTEILRVLGAILCAGGAPGNSPAIAGSRLNAIGGMWSTAPPTPPPFAKHTPSRTHACRTHISPTQLADSAPFFTTILLHQQICTLLLLGCGSRAWGVHWIQCGMDTAAAAEPTHATTRAPIARLALAKIGGKSWANNNTDFTSMPHTHSHISPTPPSAARRGHRPIRMPARASATKACQTIVPRVCHLVVSVQYNCISNVYQVHMLAALAWARRREGAPLHKDAPTARRK
jgi:hypothetical protein